MIISPENENFRLVLRPTVIEGRDRIYSRTDLNKYVTGLHRL